MPIPSPSSVLLRTQSDERLVVLARDGHERACEAIVERYRGALLRSARRYLPEARAEDALQQAYIAAWSALQRGDEVRDLRAWLYRIVHNTALNQLRVAGYDYAELDDALRGTDAPQEEMERRAVVRQTLTGLAALPERQREALLRVAVEGRSQEEVARELGVTEGAVRQLVHRARLTLRAAATAIVPLPLAQWAAAAGASGAGAPSAERIAELIAGTGASAFAAKAGVAAVLATSTVAVAGPSIVSSGADPPPRHATPARTVTPTPEAPPVRTAVASPTATAPRAPTRSEPRVPERAKPERERTRSRTARPKRDAAPQATSTPAPRATATPDATDDHGGSSNSGPGSGSDDSGHSGSGSSGSGSSGSGSGSSGSDSSGSGSSGSGSSGSGSDSSGSGSSGSNSGSGSGSGSATATPTAAPTTTSNSGPGSGSSGSSDSGSGSSGSGSSGSGHGGDDD
jgi:RNA polymerase sigma factor (sigma-70 family)